MVEIESIIEKLEHGIMVCEATKTTIVHLDKGDAEKVLELLKEQESVVRCKNCIHNGKVEKCVLAAFYA